MLVLVKCYAIKMVLLPFYLFITSLIKPEATNQQQKKVNCFVFLVLQTCYKECRVRTPQEPRGPTKSSPSDPQYLFSSTTNTTVYLKVYIFFFFKYLRLSQGIYFLYFLLLQIPPFILRYIFSSSSNTSVFLKVSIFFLYKYHLLS